MRRETLRRKVEVQIGQRKNNPPEEIIKKKEEEFGVEKG